MKRFEEFNDKELMRLLQFAREMRDGKYITAIQQEITRRNREE